MLSIIIMYKFPKIGAKVLLFRELKELKELKGVKRVELLT